jgi:hypothetical protein
MVQNRPPRWGAPIDQSRPPQKGGAHREKAAKIVDVTLQQ